MEKPTWQNDLTKLLRETLQTQKERNPRFSIRGLAKKVGLSPSSLSDILREKPGWRITPERAATILRQLPQKASVKNKLLVKIGQPPAHKKKALPPEDYSILADWAYYPILFSFDLPRALAQPAKIAARLGIEESKVLTVIKELLRRGHLVKNANGRISRPELFVHTTDGPPDAMIRLSHETSLSLSHRALEKLPAHRRDFTSLTFAGSEKKMAFLRDEIRKLHEKASSLMDDGKENDGVFRLSVQLFPIEFGGK